MGNSHRLGNFIATLWLAAIATSFIPCHTASAEVLLSENFGNDPHWTTDQPGNFFWNSASGTYFARAFTGVPNYRPSRFSVLSLPDFNPTKSFTLSWDQRLVSINQPAMVFFGVFGPDLLNDGVSSPLPESTINLGVGRAGSSEFTETNIRTKTGTGHGVGGSHGPTFALNVWYRFTIRYDAAQNTVAVRAVQHGTGAVMLYFDATYPITANAFGGTMVNFGIATDPLGQHPSTIWYNQPTAYIEAEFDNILLEGERRQLPAPPTHLASTWINGRVLLNWRDLASNEMQFKVERRADPGGTFAQIATTARNVNVFSDAGSVTTNSYCYRIRAANSDGDSGYSNDSCIGGTGLNTTGQVLQFSSASYSFAGVPGDASLIVTRTGGASGSISVNLLVSGGTASAGDDYTILTSGIVTFASGETSKVVPVMRITADSPPNSRTVIVRLATPTGDVTLGSPNTATLTINGMAAEPPGAIGVFDTVCVETSGRMSCDGEHLKLTGYPGGAPSTLESMNVRRVGAAADGTTLLLLRVRSSTPVTFSLKKSGSVASAEYGTLRSRTGTSSGQSITVWPESSPATAYAVYHAPVDVPTDATGLTIEASNQAGTSVATLTLTSPPVVLIHGLWSSSSAFADRDHLSESLYAYLVNRNYVVVAASYQDDNAGSFDPARYSTPILALSDATKTALRKARARNIAASQVDVVAHSMGGLVARARATGLLPKGFSLMRDLVAYKRPENRSQGEFHKLITVGTPHQGTPFAPWLLEHKCEPRIARLFGFLDKPFGEAVYQMQPSHEVLRQLGAANVLTHTIAGKTPSHTTLSEDLMDGLIVGTDTDTILGGDRQHDILVPLASQLAGRSSGAASSVLEGVIHSDNTRGLNRDIAETTTQRLFPLVDTLLRARRHDSFSFVGQPWISGQPIAISECPGGNQQYRDQAATAEATLTPAAGTIVRPGDEIQVAFSTSDATATAAIFVIRGGMMLVDGTEGVFNTTYTVPTSAAGDLPIHATTTGTNGGEDYAASTYVTVLPAIPPERLTVSPNAVDLTVVHEALQLTVNGEYSDGSVINLTSATAGTTYVTKTGTTAVVSVGAGGFVEARGNGDEVVMIRNGALVTAVSVTVNVTNQRPSLSALANIEIHPGEAIDIPLAATDSNGNALQLTGVMLPLFASVIDNHNGTGSLQLRPTANDAGTYEIPIVVTDDGTPPLGVSQTAHARVYEPFTNDPLVPRVTTVRAVHMTELRTRIDGLRARWGLSAFAWSDSSLGLQTSAVHARHVLDLRSALRDVYVEAGSTPPSYTDSILNAGSAIKAVHLGQIRAAVVAIE
jgi:pimeloyl-ACP methyl ester carboxylesterase